MPLKIDNNSIIPACRSEYLLTSSNTPPKINHMIINRIHFDSGLDLNRLIFLPIKTTAIMDKAIVSLYAVQVKPKTENFIPISGTIENISKKLKT